MEFGVPPAARAVGDDYGKVMGIESHVLTGALVSLEGESGGPTT